MTIFDAETTTEMPDDDGMDGQSLTESQEYRDSIQSIRENYAHRCATIKSIRRINSQTLAMMRRCLGYQTDQSEAQREKVCKLAQDIVSSIENGEKPPAGQERVADLMAPFVYSAQKARAAFEDYREKIERSLRKEAKALPVYQWVKGVKGLGELSLAIIVGECGDLGGYANPAKLWKRLGLAVMGQVRQGGLPKGSAAGEWVAHGYSPRRRSAMWTIGDSMLRQKGELHDLYMERKAVEFAKAEAAGLIVVTSTKATAANWVKAGLPEPTVVKKIDLTKHRTCGHIAKRAQRYVEKRVLRDLWRAWRDCGKEC